MQPHTQTPTTSRAGDLVPLTARRGTHTQTEENMLSLIYSIIRAQCLQWLGARRVCVPVCRLNGIAQYLEYLVELAIFQGRVMGHSGLELKAQD